MDKHQLGLSLAAQKLGTLCELLYTLLGREVF